ncbi:MAG: trigger factor [Bacteroidales bacterium]|nr:trigger factor [Bacteroidales bacterium]
MNITIENVDALNAIIRVEISPVDYEENIDKKLREYRRKANIPGFRPGNVPMPIIRKMYRTSLLSEEIYKLSSEGLFNHIKENKIDILGQPLSNLEKNTPIDWHEQKDFVFFFDIGLKPVFEVKLDAEELGINYHQIKIDDSFIDSQIEVFRKQYGKVTNPDVSEENDSIYGNFEELDNDGNIKTDGITNKATIYPLRVEKKDLLIGLKVNDTINIDIKELYKNDEKEIAFTLNIDKEKVADINNPFKFTVESISRHEPADLNEEFYKKMFPYAEIKTEEEFRDALSKDFSKQSESESDKKFVFDIQKKLIDSLKFDLPETFLKRWILEANEEKNLTPESLDADFDKYAESIKWQVIEAKILADNDIHVEKEDVTNYVKSWFQVKDEPVSPEMEERADSIVKNILSKEDEAKRIYDKLLNDRLLTLYKEKVKAIKKEISFEEFVKLG